jgi:hypothetical protein
MTNQLSLFRQPTADRLIKLRDVERALTDCFHRDSRPSRNTIIGWIEEGRLLGKQIGSGHNYYVWESSLLSFRENLTSNQMAIAA